MKEGWTYKKLGEVCETLNGLWKGKKPPFVNVGVIRNANFTKDFTLRYDNVEYLDVEEKQYVKRKLQRGDLIIEKSGGSEKQPVGRAVLFDKENGEFSFSNFTSVLRVKNGILQSRFLYIYLLFIYKRGDTLKMQKATTGIHNIEFDKYLNIDIPILPFAQQQRIVSHLDAAFAHIDALKANAEKQLAEARQLFQAELAECMRPKEGWEEKKFGDVCFYHKEQGAYKDMKYIGMEHMESGTGNILGYMSSNDVLSNSFKFNKGEVLYGRLRPYLRKVYIAEFDGCCSTEVFPIKSDVVESGFIKYWLLTDEITNKINASSAGCRMPRGNMNEVKEYPFYYPKNKKNQQTIVSLLDALSANIKKLEEVQRKTLAECDALKQAMLREVFE